MTTVRDLAQRDSQAWHRATRHPFLDGARDGSLSEQSFARWLEQDGLFVEALVRAWARILVDAPGSEVGLLADGIASFAGELAWFDDVASRRKLSIDAEPLPVARAYIDWLAAVAARPYVVAMAAMWVVEAAYYEAWRTALPGHADYREFVEHWALPEFGAFVERVESAANRAIETAAPDLVEEAAAAIATTVAHEGAFWGMTWTDPGVREVPDGFPS